MPAALADQAIGKIVATCPSCSQSVAAPTLDMLVARCRFKSVQEVLITELWRAGGMRVTKEKLIGEMYRDDPDGGPEPGPANQALKECIKRMRGKMLGTGITIVSAGYGWGYMLVISCGDMTARPADLGNEIGRMLHRLGELRVLQGPAYQLAVDALISLTEYAEVPIERRRRRQAERRSVTPNVTPRTNRAQSSAPKIQLSH